MLIRKLLKRTLSVGLSVAMVFQPEPATALAAKGNAPQAVEQTTEEGSEPESASDTFSMNLPDEKPFEIDATDIYAGLNQSNVDLNAADVSASVYDPRGTGTITAVRNQGSTSTCWAFGLTAAIETSMIMQGLADSSIDLSERHLAYFTYNTGCDRLGNASDDSIETDPLRTYLDAGGNTLEPTIRLMNWQGMASESAYPFGERDELLTTISSDAAQDAVALVHDTYFVPLYEATTEQKKMVVKELISKYGSVAWSYAHVDEYYNWDTAAYYNPNSGTNHIINIVGWDDTFSKDKFNTTPAGDGAWIVKNSWDTWFGDEGYIYISYYDASLGSGNAAAVVVACDTDTYDNNYFYGNTSTYASCVIADKVAQVFEAKGSTGQEKLTAVSVMMNSDKADYSIQVYKNPDKTNGVVTNPESGTKMLDQPVTGTTGYAGLYTIDLPEPVIFDEGDDMSIVISFTEKETVWADKSAEWEYPLFDGSGSYTVKLTNTTHPGQSFAYDYGYNDTWEDIYEPGYSTRINALTVDANRSSEEDMRYKVTFLDADGNVINTQTVRKGGSAVAPAAPIRKGYVFRDWSGSYKNITADTTLTAAYDLVEYTIRYELNGGISAETNPARYTVESDDIILAEPTKAGYLFLGWYEQSDFSGMPVTAINKGSAGDLTLYARWEEETTGVMTPIFIPSSGIVDETQTITIKSNSGAKIYYTTDGATPTIEKGILYSEPFHISKDVTIKAIAVKDGKTSDVAETQYSFYLISLELSDAELTLTKGETKSLTTTKLPTEREKTDLRWSSSDESVATVSDEGVITAVKKGAAVITASTTDYMLREVSATCSVTVINPKHTVIFRDADGNQIGEAQQIEEGADAVPPTAPQREGYAFKGWSSSYEKIMSDTTLTAEYTPVEYSISYMLNVNGATNAESNPAKYTIESDDIILAAPACEGYIFIGWYDSSSFRGEKITEIPQGSTGDRTLYARWHEGTGLWVTHIDDQIYTGKAVKPDGFTVYDGLTELTQGVDYTVSYKYNINASTNGSDKAPCVIIKGRGNYTGTVTKTFRILPVDLAEASIDDIAVAYKASVQKPKPVVNWNGRKLSLNKDYELRQAQGYSEPATYRVTVCGKGNFTGEKSFQFTIMNGEQKLISKVKKSKIPNQEYTGNAAIITPEMLTLTDGKYILKEGNDADYTLEYGACINAGTYEVLIRGRGKYQGVTRTSFRILGTDIKKTTAEWKTECIYNGMEQTPKPVIADKATKNPLTEGEDYEIVSYSNNTSAGTAKVMVRGIGAYSGTTTFFFKIKPASASDVKVMFTNGSKDQPYEKGGVKPKPIVTLGAITLTEGTDYTLSYKNNTACSEKNGKKPTVIIKGKKNLTGAKDETFDIVRKDIREIGLLLLPDVEYNSRPGKFRTTPQLFDTNGKKLSAGTDYEKEITYSPESGTPNVGDEITVTITGKGAYEGTITGTYRIIDKNTSLAKAKVKVNRNFYYTGDEISLTKEDLTVILNEQAVTDYRIIPYPDNTNRGKAKFLLVGEGEYGGQKTITITIKPQILQWWK